MRKTYYRKLAFLGMLLIVLMAFQNYMSREKPDFPEVRFISETAVPAGLSEFDPNTLDGEQWKKLGFSEKQAATILNYKKMIGGTFTSKEQFKKCYAVSPEKFALLEPYLLLSETGENRSKDFKSFEKNTIRVSGKFNPDRLSAEDWERMGFSEKQALAILKYRKYLGGSFISKEKFKECFIISDEVYRQLDPHLLLPSKAPDHFGNSDSNDGVQSNISYRPFDPNTLNLDGWKALGFSEKQAATIVNYRDRNLHGSFKSFEDIQKCFVISPEKFRELKPYIRLNPATAQKDEKQQEKTDFSKTDLNIITYKQLLEFGLDEKSAGYIIGFRKKLGGFVNKEQILETYNIDKEAVQKLVSICPLDASGVPRYALTDAPEEWLKNHPYFKYSADKILFYRISNSDDKKIWKLLKLKPEYEARMKLYLK
ncbi:hypothetical protein [Chryseobacterium sp.]|uniref:hypothetical protein n=1 Tax=Chryseobacterium sp. TaxID=1871047 RepID=UPI0038CD28F0